MKKYIRITINSFITTIIHRVHTFFLGISNIFYIILIYFLWKAIYNNDTELVLNGMTFNEAFVYLAIASSIYILFQTYTEWRIGRTIMTGNVVVDLMKPYDFQLRYFFEILGMVIFNLLVVTIPTILVVFFIFNMKFAFGLNLVFFILSLSFALIISFAFDFYVGMAAFYTESIWGISVAKEVVVMVLAGAMIPLSFFPQGVQKILNILPFAAIYHIPLSILISDGSEIIQYLKYLGLQFFWALILIIISRLFYRQALKAVTVNGG